jgi:hypothetical protein
MPALRAAPSLPKEMKILVMRFGGTLTIFLKKVCRIFQGAVVYW